MPRPPPVPAAHSAPAPLLIPVSPRTFSPTAGHVSSNLSRKPEENVRGADGEVPNSQESPGDAARESGDESGDASSPYGDDPAPEEYEAVDGKGAAAPVAANGGGILAEAQYVRHKDSAYWRMAYLLPTRHMHQVSATPTLNHVRDIKGHCLLLMKVSGVQEAFDVPVDPDRLDQVVAPGYDAAAVEHTALGNEGQVVPSVWGIEVAKEREPGDGDDADDAADARGGRRTIEHRTTQGYHHQAP
ncbi:hypothetical protein DL770_006241 [Monosporascus sp. CRB-9-2]|nr:hypothetical protein DL770_006241 [Monosporascus sp. CRB-9-2]